MSKTNDGGPAFPTEPNTQPGYYVHHGMSLRDYFAGQALVGFGPAYDVFDRAEALAKDAYAIADAMLKAREVKT